jgi:hypothetical protein
MTIDEKKAEYSTRNKNVCLAYGLKAGLQSITERMEQRRDYPVWLRVELCKLTEKANHIVRPLVAYRDELTWTKSLKGRLT